MTKTGDGWTHGTPYCGHEYVSLKCGALGMSLQESEHNNQDWCVMKLSTLGNGLYCVQSGVFLTEFRHRLLLSLSAHKRAGKK